MKAFKPLLGILLAWFCTVALASVDINKADGAQLQEIKSIGPSMSGKIIEARKTGPFKDWDDLLARVKGVGPGNATKLSGEGLTVNGAAFGAAPAAAAPAQTAKAKPVAPAKK